MEKTSTVNQNPNYKRERFEFILSINGNIVCQRYFKMEDFKKKSYSSIELVEAIDKCVDIIDRDLRDKSQLYLKYTAPQIFGNKEEMEKWVKTSYCVHTLDVPSFVMFRDSNDVFVWDGKEMLPYGKQINRMEYYDPQGSEIPATLKFSFLDFGREVCSKVWDGSVYPRFVRTNIDLSNSRNKYKEKYKSEGAFAPVESAMMDIFIAEHEDLIPKIVNTIVEACSYEEPNDYTDSDVYDNEDGSGAVTYNFNINAQNMKYLRSLEDKKKTAEYFGYATGAHD